MTDEAAPPDRPWWEAAKPGEPIFLGYVKIDRVGSTKEWETLPREDVEKRRVDFARRVGQVATDFKAAQPLHFQGDGVMLFLHDARGPIATARLAYAAARRLWEATFLDRGFSVRIAVHAGEPTWNPDTGQLADPTIDQCGHLEHVAPVDAIAVSEDVALVLEKEEQGSLAPLGVTRRDGIPALVFPAGAAKARRAEEFDPDAPEELWEALRRYVRTSGEISRLRYVGFRLAKKEPPSLRLDDVFIEPEVESRSRRDLSAAEWAALADLEKKPERPDQDARPKDEEKAGEPTEAAPWSRLRTDVSSKIEPFSEAFRRHHSLIVLGDPGSGKTTLLKWLAVASAAGPIGLRERLGVSARLLPIPVSVGRLAEIRRDAAESAPATEVLAEYLRARNVDLGERAAEALRTVLSNGSALVLLDGLDEVRAEERLSVRSWLETFIAQYPRCRFVATSRIVGYGGIDIPGAAEVVVRPLTSAQVERFVEAFTRAYLAWETDRSDDAAAAEEARRLREALTLNDRLSSLARNPFLLSALALIHRAEGRIPRHRVQVYDVFARALCETWSSARRLVAGISEPDLDYDTEAIPILGHLALRMHEEWPTGTAPTEFVVESLADALRRHKGLPERDALRAAKSFLKKAGEDVQILAERGPDRWGFLHLTFEEFFAAAGLHADERFEAFLSEHLFDPRWREVLRLGIGYLVLIQKRPRAAADLIKRVLSYKPPAQWNWQVAVIEKQIPLAALLLADAGNACGDALVEEVAASFLRWCEGWPLDLADAWLTEMAFTPLGRTLEAHLLEELPLAARLEAGRIRELRALRSDGELELARAALRELSPYAIVEAYRTLSQRGELKDFDLVVEHLTVLMRHGPVEAAALLISLDRRRALELFRECSRHESPQAIDFALLGLALLGDPAAMERLPWQSGSRLRPVEAVALGRFLAIERAEDSVRKLLGQLDAAPFGPAVRYGDVVIGLGENQTQAATEALSAALSAPDLFVGHWAAIALAKSTDVARRALATTWLISEARSDNRLADLATVAATLASRDHPDAVDWLEAQLKAGFPGRAEWARIALRVSGRPAGRRALREAIQQKRPTLDTIAELLGAFGDPEDVPLLLGLIEGNQAAVSDAARRSLLRISESPGAYARRA